MSLTEALKSQIDRFPLESPPTTSSFDVYFWITQSAVIGVDLELTFIKLDAVLDLELSHLEWAAFTWPECHQNVLSKLSYDPGLHRLKSPLLVEEYLNRLDKTHINRQDL